MEQLINQYPREDYFLKMNMDLKKVLIFYGKHLQKNGISGEGTVESYINFINNMELIEKENQINDFVQKLVNEEYKVILYNGQTPILKDDLRTIDCMLSDLNEESVVDLNNDSLVIHNDNEKIELTGYKEMSDNEIIARRYLDGCYGTLILKDHEMQTEFRDENFHDAKDYYDKCKDIVDINIFVGDESDPVWRMNWDAMWVEYDDGRKELWQRE